MKILRVLCLAVVASFSYLASAQVPIGPFASPVQERFDLLAPGSYAGFVGFGGVANFARLGGGGLVVWNSPSVLPPLSAPNAMFGRGADVRIRFQQNFRRFGGFFRVASAGIAVTQARFHFYQGAVLVGVTVGPINPAGYVWHGWDLSAIGGFNRVEIFGNGAIPGYVGMDNMVVR